MHCGSATQSVDDDGADRNDDDDDDDDNDDEGTPLFSIVKHEAVSRLPASCRHRRARLKSLFLLFLMSFFFFAFYSIFIKRSF